MKATRRSRTKQSFGDTRLLQVVDVDVHETLRAERIRVAGALANSILRDLKNPVCIARCCSDLIVSESADSQLRELSSMLTEAVNGILGTTQDLVDYTRGSISVNKRSVSVWRLLDELSHRSLQLLAGKNIKLVKHIRYQANIDIDLARFERAFSNLLENAMRALPRGGVITLTIDLIDESVAIRISDTGCGIEPELLPRVFEPFDARSGSDGTGTGLAVTKAIVEAHGGKISIASVLGKGTTVDIRLPKPSGG